MAKKIIYEGELPTNSFWGRPFGEYMGSNQKYKYIYSKKVQELRNRPGVLTVEVWYNSKLDIRVIETILKKGKNIIELFGSKKNLGEVEKILYKEANKREEHMLRLYDDAVLGGALDR
jgi:hypothetical protein